MTVERNTPYCPLCESPMIFHPKGKFGPFYGCSNYPKCKKTISAKYEKKIITKVALPENVVGTEEQDNFWRAIQENTQHVILSALAGAGKTFSIVNALRYLVNQHVIFVAFNKHIVDELESRIPEGMIAKTMNSFGRLQVVNYFPHLKKFNAFEEDKLWRIIETYVNKEDDNAEFIVNAVHSLVTLCKVNLLDGKDIKRLDALCLKHGVDTNDLTNAIYTLVPQVLNQCKVQNKTIDFADQLWYVYAYGMPVETFDVMLADEIQDWNPLQQLVAIKALGKNGRFVGVGDKHQSIYGFSGADTNSIANLTAMLAETSRNVLVKPLTYTRRCPKTHVSLAQVIVPEFKAFDDAKEGFVAYPNYEDMISLIKQGDMIICRRNSPLISLAYTLIKKGMPVIVKGRDIGKSVIVLINKLSGKKITKITDLLDKAEIYRAKEIEKLQKQGKKAESAMIILNDKIDTLIALCEDKDTVKELIEFIDQLFQENNTKNAVLLSSVHKCKGLENDTVFVIQYDKIEIPLKDAELAQQEKWLHYIALTRSKNGLYLVVSE